MKQKITYGSLLFVFLLADASLAQIPGQSPLAKVGHSLITLHQRYSARLATPPTTQVADDPFVRLVGDRVVVDAVAEGDVEALKTDLELLGMQEAVVFGRIVSGQLPIASIPDAAVLANLRFAQAAAAITHAGLVTSQGDRAQRSDAVRNVPGFDGTGINVGVLSDSYNCLNGAPTDIQSDDLSTVSVLQELSGCMQATDEGRAMLQIVHDVAPGAVLSFATALNGTASFAANIVKLKQAGARVIVDDVVYFTEPMFQDGIIAQAVDQVVAEGVAYFSSAGNSGRRAYQSAFRNSGNNLGSTGTNQVPSVTAFFAHDFDPGPGVDVFQSVTLPAGRTCFSFQWADRYFSASGNPGAQADLNVAIFSNGKFLFGMFDDNLGNDPIETNCVTNANPGLSRSISP